MAALAHIFLLLLSSTWAANSRLCIQNLLGEAYASAPLSVATAEVGKTHFVFRLERRGQIILTYGDSAHAYPPMPLPEIPESALERADSVRTLVTRNGTIDLFVGTSFRSSYLNVYRMEVSPRSDGAIELSDWKLAGTGISPLFQPIGPDTFVEISEKTDTGEETGTIWVTRLGERTRVGQLNLIPESFVAFVDPKLTLWVVGTKKGSSPQTARRLYSWSPSKASENGQTRPLHPNSFQHLEFPISLASGGGTGRDGLVVKTVLTRGRGKNRQIFYRVHRYHQRLWSLVGLPEGTTVRSVRGFTGWLLRGEAAVRKLEAAFAKVGISERGAIDVARMTLNAEDSKPGDEGFPALFVPDFDLIAETFNRPAGEMLESLNSIDDLLQDPRPHGTREQHPEAWRQWVGTLVLQGIHSNFATDDDSRSVLCHRFSDELQALPALADAPFWELIQLALQRIRAEQDYNESP